MQRVSPQVLSRYIYIFVFLSVGTISYVPDLSVRPNVFGHRTLRGFFSRIFFHECSKDGRHSCNVGAPRVIAHTTITASNSSMLVSGSPPRLHAPYLCASSQLIVFIVGCLGVDHGRSLSARAKVRVRSPLLRNIHGCWAQHPPTSV